MSVKKDRKTGKWQARYYVRKDDGTLKFVIKKGFNSADDARNWEISHKHESYAGNDTTFGAVFELMSLANRANQTTTETRRQRLKTYAGELWDKPMKKITKSVLQKWRIKLETAKKKNGDSLKTQTKNDIIGYVKQVGKFAWENYDIPDNCKVLKSFPKQLDDYNEMVIINYDEFCALQDAEKDEVLKIFFQFLYMSGARKGEARCLLKEDFDGEQVHIYKSMRRYESSVKTTKTGNSRWVPMDDDTKSKLMYLKRRPGKYLFGDATPISLTKIDVHFQNDLKEAGLQHMRIHDLRHSHVSMLWHAGVPVPEISKRIGHASPKVTMERYAHIFDNKQSASLAALNSLVKEKKK